MTTEIEMREGDWRQIFADTAQADALICDPPYSERTAEGFRTGSDVAKTGIIDYGIFTQKDARILAAFAMQLHAKWAVVFNDHIGWRYLEEAFDAFGWYCFAPVPWVKADAPPRMQGDGPASQTATDEDFAWWSAFRAALMGVAVCGTSAMEGNIESAEKYADAMLAKFKTRLGPAPKMTPPDRPAVRQPPTIEPLRCGVCNETFGQTTVFEVVVENGKPYHERCLVCPDCAPGHPGKQLEDHDGRAGYGMCRSCGGTNRRKTEATP